jgi:hypothetical protein
MTQQSWQPSSLSRHSPSPPGRHTRKSAPEGAVFNECQTPSSAWRAKLHHRPVLHQAKQRSVDTLRYFTIIPAQGTAELRRVAAELEWLDSTVDDLVAELD